MFHIAGKDITGKDDYYIFQRDSALTCVENDRGCSGSMPWSLRRPSPDENGMHTTSQ